MSALKNYLKNAISKIIDDLTSFEPIGNPNAFLNRIRVENEIESMKANLYSQSFSCLKQVFKYPYITGMRGLHPIPREIKKIVLYPIDYVFLEEIYRSTMKFSDCNEPFIITRYTDVNQNGNYVINRFKFGTTKERKLLVKKINFEIHKLFVLDYKDQLDLRPFIEPIYQGDIDYYFCQGCWEFLHKDTMNPKDYGVCSINCGMSIRGLSYSDFI